MSVEQVVADAKRINAFLEDDVIKLALDLLAKKYHRAFLDATDNEQRISAQAKALVLEDFTTALGAVVQAGEHEVLSLERKARRDGTSAPTPKEH